MTDPQQRPAQVRSFLLGLQASIVASLEQFEPDGFDSDEWKREEGGGGISRVVENGAVFERAGVLFSHVQGA